MIKMKSHSIARKCFRVIVIFTIVEYSIAIGNSQIKPRQNVENSVKSINSNSSSNGRSSRGGGVDRSLFIQESRKSSDRGRLGGEHSINIGIPIPDIPDPIYSVTQHLDYWPYKKTTTISVVTLIRSGIKLLWYLYDIACIGFRIAFQVFDIFQMKKSFDYLNHHTGGGGGWGWDDRKRSLHHVLH